MQKSRGKKSMAIEGTEGRPECERAWCKIRVVFPLLRRVVLYLTMKPAVFQTFPPHMLVQGLHYNDCIQVRMPMIPG